MVMFTSARLARDLGTGAAAAVVVWMCVAAAVEPGAHARAVVGAALGGVVGVVLVVLRHRPGLGLVGCAAAVIAYQLSGYPAIGLSWPLLVPMWAAARAGGLTPAAVLVGVLGLGSAGWRTLVEDDGVSVLLGEAQSLAVAGLALAVGDAMWQRDRRAVEREAAAAAAAEAAEQDAQGRLVEQRLVLAADLHDLAAHHLVLIGLQLRLAEESAEGASQACVAAISAALRAHDDALRETTRTVRLLHGEPPLGPPPVLGDLDRLRSVARGAGVELSLDVDRDLEVSPAVALTIFRVAQEALTNTLRHSSAQRLDLALHENRSGLHLSVVDSGPPRSHVGTGGLGLLGMTARVEDLGGRLSAGSGASGAFTVEAWLPNGGPG